MFLRKPGRPGPKSRWKFAAARSTLEARIREALGSADARFELTGGPGRAPELVRSALRAGVRRVLAVGGDGTLSEVVQGFFEQGRAVAPEAELGLIPLGRGNDFFRSLAGDARRPGEEAWETGLRLVREGEALPVDVGRVRFLAGTSGATEPRYFMNVASFGFPGLVVDRVVKRRGLLARTWVGRSSATYLYHSLAGMGEYAPLSLKVSLDGAVLRDGEVFSGFVLNGACNAGGVRWSDRARIDDGTLEVTVLEPRPLLATLRSVPKMASGRWAGTPGVHVGSGREVRVELRDARAPARPAHSLFEIDGEIVEPPGTWGAEFKVLPGAIRMRRPAPVVGGTV